MKGRLSETSATPNEGVLETEVESTETQPVARTISRREQAMQLVEASAAKVRAADEHFTEPEAVEVPDEVDEQIEAQMEEEVISDPSGKKVRVKVDGVEQEVPLDDVLRTFQKNAAADKRLEEATRLLKEAKQQQAEPHQVQLVEQTEPEAPLAPEAIEKQVQAALEAIYSGDQEVAKDALVKAFTKVAKSGTPAIAPTMPQIDYAEVATRVQQLREVDTALEKIRSDYPEVIANPDIELLTAIKVNARVADGMPRHQAMLESAKEVYASLGKTPGRRQPEQPSESRDEKLKRKAGRDYIVPASISAEQSLSDTGPADPISEIQKMAKGRMGQSLAIAGR